MRSRALPHAWASPTLPSLHEAHRGARLTGMPGREESPIAAFPGEKQQMAVKTNRTLVLLLEPKVETKSSIFLCKVLLNYLFILCLAGEVTDTANGRSEFEFTGRLL